MRIAHEQLTASFEELFLIEKKAHDYYQNLLDRSLSEHEEKIIQEIHDDEEKHMRIVKEILQIIGDKK